MSFHRGSLLAITIASFVAGGASAQSFILPKGAGPRLDSSFAWFWGGAQFSLPIHVQTGYATADMKPAAQLVRKIAWRRDNFFRNAIAKSTTTMDVFLSHGTKQPSDFSTTFAANRGQDHRRVFRGQLNWPASTQGTGAAAFTYVVPLSTPFLVTKNKGKSIVIEGRITARSHAIGSRQSVILLDAIAAPTGTRTNNGRHSLPSTCLNSAKKSHRSLSFQVDGLTNYGGSWRVSYNGVLPNAVGMTMISAIGAGQKWGKISIPIDLKGFGMPKCWFNTGLEGVWIPWSANAAGRGALPTLKIPSKLGGASFYDQGIYLDKKANARGLVTTWSSKWTITKDPRFDVITVYRTLDKRNLPTGFLREYSGAIVELGS